MDRGQIFGGIVGLGMLLSAFLLPFSAIAEGPGGSPDTLIGIFKLFVTTLNSIETIGLTQLTELAYVYMAAFVLIILAGVIGAYPRWAAIFGIIGMAMVTVAPFAIFPNYNFFSSNYQWGFFAIWVACALFVVASVVSSRSRPIISEEESGPLPEVSEDSVQPGAPDSESQ
ncbi:MAG TPA: hypothetical protein VEB67_02580 [Nitrososphaerales archaeon]|nr:hypothetical protein [Nitrososphaerales archaeon]